MPKKKKKSKTRKKIKKRKKSVKKRKSLKKKIHYRIKKKIKRDNVKQKDINDMILSGMTRGDVYKTIRENTYKGVHAKTRFVFWKRVDTNEKIFRNKNK